MLLHIRLHVGEGFGSQLLGQQPEEEQGAFPVAIIVQAGKDLCDIRIVHVQGSGLYLGIFAFPQVLKNLFDHKKHVSFTNGVPRSGYAVPICNSKLCGDYCHMVRRP